MRFRTRRLPVSHQARPKWIMLSTTRLLRAVRSPMQRHVDAWRKCGQALFEHLHRLSGVKIMSHNWRRVAACSARLALLFGLVGPGLAATPTTQQAIVQVAYGGPEVLQIQTVPVLQPGPNQVLVRTYAAGLNPTDWYMRMDTPGYTTVPTPVIPGGDVAGVIEKLGSGVNGLKVGDRVFAVIGRSG